MSNKKGFTIGSMSLNPLSSDKFYHYSSTNLADKRNADRYFIINRYASSENKNNSITKMKSHDPVYASIDIALTSQSSSIKSVIRDQNLTPDDLLHIKDWCERNESKVKEKQKTLDQNLKKIVKELAALEADLQKFRITKAISVWIDGNPVSMNISDSAQNKNKDIKIGQGHISALCKDGEETRNATWRKNCNAKPEDSCNPDAEHWILEASDKSSYSSKQEFIGSTLSYKDAIIWSYMWVIHGINIKKHVNACAHDAIDIEILKKEAFEKMMIAACSIEYHEE